MKEQKEQEREKEKEREREREREREGFVRAAGWVDSDLTAGSNVPQPAWVPVRYSIIIKKKVQERIILKIQSCDHF